MRLLRSLLTDVAAGSTKQRITDDHVCYQWVTSLLSAGGIPVDETPSDNERLFSMCLRAVDLADVPLNDIVDFRKREQMEGSGQDLRKLRHKFSEAQDSYVEKLRSVKSRPEDTEELLRIFQEEMKEDIRALMRELTAVVIRDQKTQRRKSKSIIDEALRRESVERRVPIRFITRPTIIKAFNGYDRKYARAVALAERFPALAPKLPPKRKCWQSEDYRMSIFDAAVLGVAHFGRYCYCCPTA